MGGSLQASKQEARCVVGSLAGLSLMKGGVPVLSLVSGCSASQFSPWGFLPHTQSPISSQVASVVPQALRLLVHTEWWL